MDLRDLLLKEGRGARTEGESNKRGRREGSDLLLS